MIACVFILGKNSFELKQADIDRVYIAINQSDLDQCICDEFKISAENSHCFLCLLFAWNTSSMQTFICTNAAHSLLFK